MDSVSAARLAMVNPILAEKIVQLSATLAGENIFIRITQGLRTWDEQDKLFAQGRSLPGAKVTNARGGESYHNYGLAVDCVPDCADAPDGKFIPDWNPSHPAWKRMIEIGLSLGLTSGALWRSRPDEPHFQLTGGFPEPAPNAGLKALYAASGITGVWNAVQSQIQSQEVESGGIHDA